MIDHQERNKSTSFSLSDAKADLNKSFDSYNKVSCDVYHLEVGDYWIVHVDNKGREVVLLTVEQKMQ
jgi:ERCC4-type nuclease